MSDDYPRADQRRLIAALPFDHHAVYRNRLDDQLFARLGVERGLVAQGLVAGRVGALVCAADALDPHLAGCLATLAVQSLPLAKIGLLPADPDDAGMLDVWAGTRAGGDGPRPEAVRDARAWMADLDAVLVLDARALCHPGLALAIARTRRSDAAELIVWNQIRVAETAGGLGLAYVRSGDPLAQPTGMAHAPVTGEMFAAAPARLAELPEDTFGFLAAGDLHLAALRLARCAPAVGRIGEFLGAVRGEGYARPLRPRHPDAPAAYAALLADRDFAALPGASGAPPHQSPRRRAASIDVVINFRDKPEDTLCAIGSVLRQETAAHVTVVLVDNRSTAESRAAVRAAAEAGAHRARFVWVDYDAPFNHSDQTNRGLAASDGEVAVLMSNDCELLDPGVLDEIAAWSLAPGIGAVGPRLVDRGGNLTCSGVEGLYIGQEFLPVVTEGFDHLHAEAIREVLAVPFSCAAVARAALARFGALDAADFPIALNDVEYGLRLGAAGLRNLCLGPWRARHEIHGSRGRVDDGAQLARLRALYPALWTAKDRMFAGDFQRQMDAARVAQRLEDEAI